MGKLHCRAGIGEELCALETRC